MTTAELEIQVKLSQLPSDVTTERSGAKRFSVECDGLEVKMTLRPSHYQRIEKAAATSTEWQAIIIGRMGATWPGGFVLHDPAVKQLKAK